MQPWWAYNSFPANDAINYLSIELVKYILKKYNHIINKYKSLLFHARSVSEKKKLK